MNGAVLYFYNRFVLGRKSNYEREDSKRLFCHTAMWLWASDRKPSRIRVSQMDRRRVKRTRKRSEGEQDVGRAGNRVRSGPCPGVLMGAPPPAGRPARRGGPAGCPCSDSETVCGLGQGSNPWGGSETLSVIEHHLLRSSTMTALA